MTNTSPRLDQQDIPAEINRWNWGAFLLNWIWGIGNQTYIALLVFIPIFGLIWMFVLGAKGSAWAWRNGRWDSVEHFRRVQRLWAIWSFVILLATPVLFAALFGGLFYGMKHSVAYELAVAKLEVSPIATNILGSPISAGMPIGVITFGGADGGAGFMFTATGPKATGSVFVEAVKKDGVWSLIRLTLRTEGGGVIYLVGTRPNTT
jgi:hypothetical protein